MRTQKTPPTKGHFVAVWKHNGKLWCNTYNITDGILSEYDSYKDKWRTHSAVLPGQSLNPYYISE